MNRRLKQWICSLLVGCLMACVIPFQGMISYGATARISFSDPSGKVGEEISVTMKFTSTSGGALGNTDVMLAYDANALEYINETENASGGTGAIRVWSGLNGTTEVATVLRFKALQAGTATITITSWEGYDNDGQVLNVEKEGTSTITIAGLPTSSGDATLKSLQISPGTLNPSFAPQTEQYTTSVGLDTDKLTISANANNDKATVSVEGGTQLQDGENTVICKVTAEDGTTVKSYTILVNRVEGGGAAESQPAQEPTADATTPEVLAELDVAAKKISIISLPVGTEVPQGFKESSIKIGEATVQGWTWAADEKPKYCMFYAMNESGEQDFYRYDLTDKTVQRYFADPADSNAEDALVLQEKLTKLEESYGLAKMILFGVAAVAAILLVLLIVVLTKKGKGREYRGEEASEELPPAPRQRGSRNRRLSKEERYMIGEEEELEEAAYEEEQEDFLQADLKEAYQPDLAEDPIDDVEKAIAATLAQEAVKATNPKKKERSDLEDDFEFVDLDDE